MRGNSHAIITTSYSLLVNKQQYFFFFVSTLSGLVEFDGFYLESDPCLVCNNPEVPFSVSLLQFHLLRVIVES